MNVCCSSIAPNIASNAKQCFQLHVVLTQFYRLSAIREIARFARFPKNILKLKCCSGSTPKSYLLAALPLISVFTWDTCIADNLDINTDVV